MNRLERFATFASVAGIATGVALTEAVRQSLERLPAGVDIAAVVGIVLVSAGLVREVFEQTVERSSRLRRIVLGRRYVEGSWIDFVTRDNLPPLVGITSIEPSGSSLRYGGTNFSAYGEYLGTFTTTTVAFQWPELRFTYGPALDATEMDLGASSLMIGFGEIVFQSSQRLPSTYRGRCHDVEQGLHWIEGQRITDEADLADLATLDGQARLVRRHAAARGLTST